MIDAELGISATLIFAIIAGLWRYGYCHGFKNGYELGYKQAKKDFGML